MNEAVKELIEQCIAVIEKKNRPKIVACLDQLTGDQVWLRPNEASNSIGNLLLHLCGNIRQYVISGLGGQADLREREKEFSATGGLDKEELLAKLFETTDTAIGIIRRMDEAGLLKTYRIQGMEYSGAGVIVHITEHFSHHTGQVIFWTKQLTAKDLGFYSRVNLNQRNERQA